MLHTCNQLSRDHLNFPITRSHGRPAARAVYIISLSIVISMVGAGTCAQDRLSSPPIPSAKKEGQIIAPSSTMSRTAASRWNYNDKKDQMRGAITRFAYLYSENSLEFEFPYQGGASSTITLRDKLGKLDVLLQIDKGQFICHDFNDDTVSAKFDDGTIQSFRCGGAADGSTDTLFIIPTHKFLASLRRSKKLIIEAQFYRAGNKQMTFVTHGLRW